MHSEADQHVVNAIQQGDKIHDIIIEGEYTALLQNTAELSGWNSVLDDNFQNLANPKA